MSKPPGLNSDQLNYLIWRYLQESGYGQAAVILQRDWNLDPQSLPLAKHVKGRALIRLVQRGLEHYYLEQTITHGIEHDQLQPSMFYFGPESAQSRRPSATSRDLQKDRSPSTSNFEQSSTKTGSTGGPARKHARDAVANGLQPELPGQPAPKKSRKAAVNVAEKNGDQVLPVTVETPESHAMDVDRPNGIHPGAPSPSPTTSKIDEKEPAADEKGSSKPDVNDKDAEMTSNSIDAGTRAGSLNASVDQDEKQAHSVEEEMPEPPISHTLTNGQSVGVQITPKKAVDLESGTSILSVAGEEHVTRAVWRPKAPPILATSGDNFCGVWKFDEQAASQSYQTLLDKADGTLVSAMAWEPRGAMLAVATYNQLSGQLRIYDGLEAVLMENLPSAQKMITSLRWQNVGNRLVGFAFGGRESSLVLWDLHQTYSAGSGMHSIVVPEAIHDVDWASHGNVSMVCASGKGVVYQCRAATDFALEHQWTSDASSDDTWDFVKCSWWSEESSIVIAAAADSASLWIPTREITLRNVHSAPITALHLRPTSIIHPIQNSAHEFATASLEGTIKMWRFDDQRHELSCLFKISVGGGIDFPILASTFSTDGSHVAAASYDRVVIWDANLGGPPLAKWDVSTKPEIGWKGTEFKEHKTKPNQQEPSRMAVDNEEETDGESGDPDHSLSWHVDGKRLAFGLGTQVAIIDFNQ